MRDAQAAEWRNWARTQVARPARTVRPDGVEELSAAVRGAAGDGLRVKAVGSGHSFTGIAVTDGVMVELDRISGILHVDRASGLVSVEAGITLHRLNAVLAALGLALPNLGESDRPTIAGAISTGMHGTGTRLRGVASQVRALELVLADGSLTRCSAEQRPELFAAARVGLGALGVIASVTLQCEPAFALETTEMPMPLSQALTQASALADQNDHFEFLWYPHTRRTVTRRRNRLPDGAVVQPPGRARSWWEGEFLANRVVEARGRLGAASPALIPRLAGLAARGPTARTHSDASHRALVSPLHVVFREMEYAVPREAVVPMIRAIERWVNVSGERVALPVAVRFAASDDIWLSPAFKRETAYISVRQYHRLRHARYFRAVEEIAGAHAGRPHWGKLHGLDSAALRTRYERFDDFLALRRSIDPNGVFTNPYLDQVLG